MEGVNCVDGGESVEANCQWVHNGDCGEACATSVRASWGYESNRLETPKCKLGNKLGAGTEPSGRCTNYSDSQVGDGKSVLGWQLDVTGHGNCWAGRGNCCSDAGGSGRCANGDANGSAYAMLWVK